MLGCPLAPSPAPACPAVRDRLWPQTLSISCAHAWRLPARSAGSPEGGKGAGGAGALADSASKRKLNFAGAADAESRQMKGQLAQLKAQNNALSKALVEAKACLASSEFYKEQAQIKARKFQVYAESDPGVLAEERGEALLRLARANKMVQGKNMMVDRLVQEKKRLCAEKSGETVWQSGSLSCFRSLRRTHAPWGARASKRTQIKSTATEQGLVGSL